MKKQLPKNVRQIGNVSDSSKIYVEDYVDTFFNQLCDKTDQMPIGAFLVGADIATVPYAVIEQMTKHPLTDQGIAKFQADYKAVFGE